MGTAKGFLYQIMVLYPITFLCLFLAGSIKSELAQCGLGSQCVSSTGLPSCAPCPEGTSCTAGSSGNFYCQYSTCLPENMFCGGNIGTCCSGLKCGAKTVDAIAATCNGPTTTTTTPIIIVVTTVTTTTASTTASSTSCVTVGGNKIGLPCVFPFTHMGITHTSCTTAGGFTTPWCSTATDVLGNHVIGNWGDCGSSCQAEQTSSTLAPSTCSTKGGADSGKKCVFPFKYNGVVHSACTYARGFSKPWCATRVDYWGRHMEGYWGDCDASSCPVEQQLWG